MSDEHDDKPTDDPVRAFREPFVLAQDWAPLYGHCSKCKRLAVLYEDRWHHDGAGCDPSKFGKPEFILGAPPDEEGDGAEPHD